MLLTLCQTHLENAFLTRIFQTSFASMIQNLTIFTTSRYNRKLIIHTNLHK